MGRVGDIVGDRYRLIERLGNGGMSVVWRGYDEVLGREVAVKVLAPELDASFRDRLRQEALAAARLCHPHITGIFDFGESPLTAYVVMELNDGISIATRLQRYGALPWRDAVTAAAEIASALATAHARGVVHRDVTPANVMLTRSGAKVVDFGISALIGQCDSAPDGSLLGTPAYLAPERLTGGQVSPAADVYALGLLLYRSLTGHLPWHAGSTTEALRAHLYADPEPLPTLPGLPAEVRDLCLRCLAKDPAARPSAALLAATLGAVIGHRPVMPPGAPARPAVRPRPHPAPRSHRRLRLAPRIGARLGLGGAARFPLPSFLGSRPGGGSLVADLYRGRVGRAAVAVCALLVGVGAAWASTREPVQPTTAQAAAAGGPGLVNAAVCKVRYQVRRDSGSDFEAVLTIVNTGAEPTRIWRMDFAYPGTQRLTSTPSGITQRGRQVVLRSRSHTALHPGRPVTFALRGGYRTANPLPLSFALDGRPCDSEVIGATSPPAPPAQQPSAVPPAAEPRATPPSTPAPEATEPETTQPDDEDEPTEVSEAAGSGVAAGSGGGEAAQHKRDQPRAKPKPGKTRTPPRSGTDKPDRRAPAGKNGTAVAV